MNTLVKALAGLAAGALFATGALAHDHARVASPYIAVENEPAPKLTVDPPLPEGLAQGIFWAQYRVENLRIVPVFGAGALTTSPRIGHLHITVDGAAWHWLDASNEPITIKGLLAGVHSVLVELADATHRVIDAQTVTFVIPPLA